MAKKETRFVKTFSQTGFVNNTFEIYVDRQTGVNYLYASGGYGGGLTVLLDANGKPVVTPIPNDYEE